MLEELLELSEEELREILIYEINKAMDWNFYHGNQKDFDEQPHSRSICEGRISIGLEENEYEEDENVSQ